MNESEDPKWIHLTTIARVIGDSMAYYPDMWEECHLLRMLGHAWIDREEMRRAAQYLFGCTHNAFLVLSERTSCYLLDCLMFEAGWSRLCYWNATRTVWIVLRQKEGLMLYQRKLTNAMRLFRQCLGEKKAWYCGPSSVMLQPLWTNFVAGRACISSLLGTIYDS